MILAALATLIIQTYDGQVHITEGLGEHACFDQAAACEDATIAGDAAVRGDGNDRTRFHIHCVLGLERQCRGFGEIVEQPDAADRWRRQDAAAVSLVVERDVA